MRASSQRIGTEAIKTSTWYAATAATSAAPSGTTPECVGDTCQGSPNNAATAGVPHSETAARPGDQPAPRPCSQAVGWRDRAARCGRPRSAIRTGRLRLVLTVTGGGRVGVRVNARTSGAPRTAGTAVTTVRGSARRRVALTVTLSSAARRHLARSGRLALTIRATVDGRPAGKPIKRLTLSSRVSKGGRR